MIFTRKSGSLRSGNGKSRKATTDEYTAKGEGKMRPLGNEGMDSAAPPGEVISREIGWKEAESLKAR